MGTGRKPKVDRDSVYQIVDAHLQPLSDSVHGKLKATIRLLEDYLADAKSSEKRNKSDAPKDVGSKANRKGGNGRNGADDQAAAERNQVPHYNL